MEWTTERLATDRLALRPFRIDDTDAVVTMLTDPVARRYLGGPLQLPADFSAEALGDQWGSWCVALLDGDGAVGACTFSRERGHLELSYSLVPTVWGLGYAREACAAALDWAWQATSDAVVIAVTQTANDASMALLDALGFEEERRFTEFGAEQSQQMLSRPA